MATLSHFPNALQVRGARQTNFADLHATVSRYGWSAEQAEAFGDLLGREHLLAEPLQAFADQLRGWS